MSTERRPGTRLPDDPAWWDDLAARSIDAAFGARDPWWRAVSDAAVPLAAAATLALLAGGLLPDRPASAPGATPIAAALAPDDALLGALIAADAAPPPPAALLAMIALREGER